MRPEWLALGAGVPGTQARKLVRALHATQVASCLEARGTDCPLG